MNNNHSSTGVLVLIIIVVAVILFIVIRKKLKLLKIPSVFLVTGAVKTGKTLLSVHLAIKQFKKNRRRWYVKRFICFLLHRPIPLKPMLYSNIPLRWVKFNKFTYNILQRKVRIPDCSVVLLDEASLIADSMLYKDKNINSQLMLFVKLFGHYTHGGSLIINTQSISDLHFSFKRCLNNYVYIYSSVKYPLITIMRVREMLYSEDNAMTNNFNEDVELSMRIMIMFNKSYKYYDRYCYSIFTDDLPYEVNYDVDTLTRFDSLKTKDLITLQDFKELLEVNFTGGIKDESEG